MNRTQLGLLLIGCVVLFVAAVMLLGNSTAVTNNARPAADPIDVATAFAKGWLQNQQATTSVPLAGYVASSSAVTSALASNLLTAAAAGPDPVLCQAELPRRIGGKLIYDTADAAQVAIVPRGAATGSLQALYTLQVEDNEWQITKIQCSAGEVGLPVGEHNFVQTGRLVRDRVPAPYDATVWHVIFADADDMVGVVPLLISAASQCDGQACDAGTFTEGAAITVKGTMTEEGVQVAVLERS